MSSEHEDKLKIGITLGDFNGVGPEVIIKTFADNRMLQVCTPIIYGSSKALSFHRKALNIQEFNYNTVRNIKEVIARKLNVINCWDEETKIEIGKPSTIGGEYAFKAIDAACKDLKMGFIDAIVTAPIDKKTIQSETFRFAGHTEYFAEQFDAKEYLMFLVSESLKVATVTGHVPLKNIAQQLSIEKIEAKIRTMHQSLKRDFGIRKPRIAVLGLNPHAGDAGVIGTEEKEIIEPAIKKCADSGMVVFGPYSADGFFATGNYKKFDAVLAMYHDQGLIPFKTLAFSNGVNFTAGLSIVRTSPDHGTAYDIAGKGIASEESFREAVYMACDIVNKRKEFDEVTAKPLAFARLGGDR